MTPVPSDTTSLATLILQDAPNHIAVPRDAHGQSQVRLEQIVPVNELNPACGILATVGTPQCTAIIHY